MVVGVGPFKSLDLRFKLFNLGNNLVGNLKVEGQSRTSRLGKPENLQVEQKAYCC